MKVNVRLDSAGHEHDRFTVFVNGTDVGCLCLRCEGESRPFVLGLRLGMALLSEAGYGLHSFRISTKDFPDILELACTHPLNKSGGCPFATNHHHVNFSCFDKNGDSCEYLQPQGDKDE